MDAATAYSSMLHPSRLSRAVASLPSKPTSWAAPLRGAYLPPFASLIPHRSPGRSYEVRSAHQFLLSGQVQRLFSARRHCRHCRFPSVRPFPSESSFFGRRVPAPCWSFAASFLSRTPLTAVGLPDVACLLPPPAPARPTGQHPKF